MHQDADIDRLLEEILVDAYGEDEQLWAFRQAFEESGLPPHPGGECPSPDCRCSEMTDSIMARAEELAADRLGIDVAELR